MRRRSYLLLATIILCLLLGTHSAWADGATLRGPEGSNSFALTVTGYSLGCTSLIVQGTSGSPFVSLILINNQASASAPVINGHYSVTLHYPSDVLTTNPLPGPLAEYYFGIQGSNNGTQNEVQGTYFELFSYTCGVSGGILTGAAGASGGVTWFAPGDNRVDGQPGDRIAVWCNTKATPPNIVVYGVGDATNNSGGFWLGTFNIADLLKAGKAGIVKDAGPGNGSVSTTTDGQGNFWSAWNGGIFNATGSPPFAKSYSCQF